MSKRPFSFLKASWLLFTAFFITFLLLAVYLLKPDPKAEVFYHHLTGSQKNSEKNGYKLQQQRKGMVKEILFNEGTQLRKLRLECCEADILFVEQEGKGEIQERMYDVIGRMQEKLYYVLPDGRLAYGIPNHFFQIEELDVRGKKILLKDSGAIPMQTINYFEADMATYTFRHERFMAEQVQMIRYTLPSHILMYPFTESTPIMTGVASKVEFSLKNRKFNILASQFKGRFEVAEAAL
ncbi:hypothetical protein [Parachlamydia sp. AcF125]|uniref:hypothetical protein n=1 Tax=Parachlamydia sp. AcF125 TaxID=2795736 RepID=UPI001BC8CCD6|nr:hypothetical protein [Parachlamydia sp. AcF125]MBS4169251.1 hypothetical protein [Parachlamydia sp. AcF125]